MRLMTRDRWAAVVCLVFAAFVIVTMPGQTSDRPIPGARGFDLLDGAFFPKIAVTLFVIASLWLFITGRPSGSAAGPAEPPHAAKSGDGIRFVAEADDEPPGLTLADFLYACGLTLGVLAYVQLLPVAGYLVSTMLAVAVLALICGQRSWLGLFAGAVIFPVVVYYLFGEIFRVPLPRPELW
jgi:putative tricarboxylic transport membrane protein